MSDVIIFEDYAWRNFLPLVYWRPVSELRCGYSSLGTLIRRCLQPEPGQCGVWVRDEIAELFRTQRRDPPPVNEAAAAGTLLVNARWLPDVPPEAAPCPSVAMVEDEVAFVLCDEALAACLDPAIMRNREQLLDLIESVPRIGTKGLMLHYPWDLIHHNGALLLRDWPSQDAGVSGKVARGAHLVDEQHIRIGEGSLIRPGAVIDASEGPIYIGNNVTVMPNAVVCGPTYIADGTVINAGAWIRTNVTIGPGCKIGGEVGASIFQAFCNKQHHGFVGHSYVAEWVNIGAGTTTSNLKNTFGKVKVPIGGVPTDTGHTFMGSIIGDFAKTGINQSLNTGSVIGFGSSLATSTINSPFVPSFRFVTDGKNEPYEVERCLEVARRSMARRNTTLSAEEQTHFRQLPAIAEKCETL